MAHPITSNHDGGEHVADLDLRPNEASGLLAVDDAELLAHYGWDRAFWTVLDEVDAADCVGLIGHRAGAALAESWAIGQLGGRRTDDGAPAQDAEALARWDGWVYVFGSHHGGKQGPIREREQWIARFLEADVKPDPGDRPCVDLTVVNTRFRLHRLVNDALRERGVELLELRPATKRAFIDATVAQLAGTPAEGRVRADDWTINIEGAEFSADGALLLGLRFPVTAAGRPLLVQLDGCAGLFEDPPRWPAVTAVWTVDAVGRGGRLAGVRDLCVVGDAVHVVTGDLDSAGKGSVIREDYPEGSETVSTHFETHLRGEAGVALPARTVEEFSAYPRIEGIAADRDGQFFYVSDEDETVRLRCTPLLADRD
ncbi:MAG: hypothetical protein M3O86_01335 [Actinomycetota bacterium]|nr:hypothetical protein [Actinomycetota bacterium]